jgi:hypothetical protein
LDDVGDYDYDDPFIDDDDDFFVEQLQIYRPEMDGYFAWRGEIPIVEVSPSSSDASDSSYVQCV